KHARPGASMLEVLSYLVGQGNYTNISPDELLEDVKKRLADSQHSVVRRTLGDGRIFAVRYRPMANGGWVSTFDDITERERIALETRQQNLLFDAAINNMSQGLCMFDAEQRLIVCNPQYVKIFGGDPEFVKPGRSLLELYRDGVARGLYRGAAEELYAER